MPDERLGERACAFVVLEDDGAGLEFGEMQKYLDSHQVAKQYWPERLEIHGGALPRNEAGKIQKFLLRERARVLRPQRRIPGPEQPTVPDPGSTLPDSGTPVPDPVTEAETIK
jgi:acyl-CoA synthetase (AMP-forming)/AMP-acid ligase II